MEIWKEYAFDAAHKLPMVPPGHPCGTLHGHSYRVRIHVEGRVEEKMGWVMDYAEITAAFEPLLQQLDHHYLNDIPGLENPTSENIARWVWRQVEPKIPGLSKIVVSETPTSACEYRGE